jgi:site-specific recombinase XerD
MLRFILSSGARIKETLHLRADKIFADKKRVELIGKGRRVRCMQVLHAEVVGELDLTCRFVYLNENDRQNWKDGLARYFRHNHEPNLSHD